MHYIYRMIYEQNCYNLNVKYFDNLIEINIKNFPKKKFQKKNFSKKSFEKKIFQKKFSKKKIFPKKILSYWFKSLNST